MIAPGYVPCDPAVWWGVLAVLVTEFALVALVGGLRRLVPARVAAWGVLVASVAGVELLTLREPAGLRMLALCAAGLYGMKGVVLVEHRASGADPLGVRAWLAFVLAWPGMRAKAFAGAFGSARGGSAPLVRKGAVALAVGTVLLAVAHLVAPTTHGRVLATVLGLPALSLLLHFGVFDVCAAAWRALGADCRELFRAPLAARSLATFWSRRWNLAFSEMLQLAVHRPLRARLGARGATFAGFAVSALLHEMALSLPVHAGFGLPTLYFLLHGALVLVEEALAARGRPVESRGVLAHVWTLTWLGAPVLLVFHPPFLEGVVWPLLGVR